MYTDLRVAVLVIDVVALLVFLVNARSVALDNRCPVVVAPLDLVLLAFDFDIFHNLYYNISGMLRIGQTGKIRRRLGEIAIVGPGDKGVGGGLVNLARAPRRRC